MDGIKKNTEFKGEEVSEQYSSGIKALMKSFQAAFLILVLIIVIMLIWFFTFGGYFTVKPQESVLVLRFGKLIAQYDESWHWVFPYPVNSIIRISTYKQKLNVPKFMSEKKGSAFGEAPPPEGEGPQGGPLVPGKDGYLLTGDANIIHTEWEIIYQIVSPQKYYMNCLCPLEPVAEDEIFRNPLTGEVMGTRGPMTLLKSLLENTIIKVTASEKAENALYKNFFQYSKTVEGEYIKAVADMDIGVSIDSVVLRGKAPPLKTVRAFQEVIAADQERDSLAKNAKSYQVETANSAEAEASMIIADAGAYRKRIVSEVKAENFYFEKILKEYQESPDTVLVSLYNYTIGEVLAPVKDKFILNKNPGSKQEVRLKLNPEPPAENKKTTENRGNQ